MPDLVQEVRRRIAVVVADPERAPAMAAYMKSAMPFRGEPGPPGMGQRVGTSGEDGTSDAAPTRLCL